MKHRLMLYIALKAGLYSSIVTSTKSIASDLKISQQSVSRLLIELEDDSLINRFSTPRGVRISVADKGVEYLRQEFSALKRIFISRKELSGVLFQGLGEGGYYVKEYSNKLAEILGYTPYPGTLNIRVKEQEARSFLSDLKPFVIKGFRTRKRAFGDIILYRVILSGVEAAIIRPERTMHKRDVLEIVGPSCFRTTIGFKDSDRVKLNKLPKGVEDD